MQRDWARLFVGDTLSVVRRAVLYWEGQCKQRVGNASASATAACAATNVDAEVPASLLVPQPAITLPLYAIIMCFCQSSGSGKVAPRC